MGGGGGGEVSTGGRKWHMVKNVLPVVLRSLAQIFSAFKDNDTNGDKSKMASKTNYVKFNFYIS